MDEDQLKALYFSTKIENTHLKKIIKKYNYILILETIILILMGYITLR